MYKHTDLYVFRNRLVFKFPGDLEVCVLKYEFDDDNHLIIEYGLLHGEYQTPNQHNEVGEEIANVITNLLQQEVERYERDNQHNL